jgi:hypothetical protein
MIRYVYAVGETPGTWARSANEQRAFKQLRSEGVKEWVPGAGTISVFRLRCTLHLSIERLVHLLQVFFL